MKECQHCKRCFNDEISICPDDGMPTFHSISGEPVLEGKYKLEKRLGQGGMGVVYCAKHSYLKTQHAIKVILPDLVGNDPQLVTRFRQEALAAAAIRHHNVIAVTDFGVVQGKIPFLVMEFVEGESLHDLLAREKRLPVERAVEIISAISAGVAAAHRQGIVHRDLKPLNIMICRDKHSIAEAVKILDFGLAKIKSGELLGSFIQAQTTGLMGSPYYMAPEQWSDEEPEAQADIYSLGVIFYQMVAGDVPFKGSSIPAIMKKHLSDPPPSFAETGVSVAPQLELAVRRALEKDKHKRTPTVGQFVDELQMAIGYSLSRIHTTGTGTTPFPVSTLHILSHPPESNVFIDNVSVGKTQNNGWLLLEGLQSGNHQIRVSREGFQDWQSEIVCDGKPKQVVAELKTAGNFSPPPPPSYSQSQPIPVPQQTGSISINTPHNVSSTQNIQPVAQQTFTPQTDGASQNSFIQTPAKKSFFSLPVLAISGIFGLLVLTVIGVVGAYLTGFIGKSATNANVTPTPTANASPVSTPKPVSDAKTEQIKIPGGTFVMGKGMNDPKICEHSVTVGDFWMDKTEVTNAEYKKFVAETNYAAPDYWKNGDFPEGKEMFPVVKVSQADAIKFAEWRSKRDNVNYRLPSEEEWEFAARNGTLQNLFPWGNELKEGRAVLNESELKPVGSLPEGNNSWGVQDLIGNVWEWTSSPLKPYPCAEMVKGEQGKVILRGGSFLMKDTNSVFRGEAKPDRKEPFVGFRLVRDDK